VPALLITNNGVTVKMKTPTAGNDPPQGPGRDGYRQGARSCARMAVYGIIIIILCNGVLLAYIFGFHRFSTLTALHTAVSTGLLPEANIELASADAAQSHGRCKILNKTHFKCLPNIFFIGASKCGTTSISRLLYQTPGVHFVRRHVEQQDKHMEVHRFDRNTFPYASTWLETADELASSPALSDPDEPLIHYTPHYLFAPTVPFEMHDFFARRPGNLIRELKFIVSLRNPVNRAMSSYWFKNSKISNGVGNKKSNKVDVGDYHHALSDCEL
jgi:hypothetical protein